MPRGSVLPERRPTHGRFKDVNDRKATGATYTPPDLAEYLAVRLVECVPELSRRSALRVLEPALGNGALALALLGVLARTSNARVSLVGYETNAVAASGAERALRASFPEVDVEVRVQSFLSEPETSPFDLAIANPPYVRTQILGAQDAAALVARFGLEGRVDMYQAFTLAILERLAPGGGLGLIASNRFLTTKGAAAFRDALHAGLSISRLWDLGDTRVFDAAILPAMLVGRRRTTTADECGGAVFTSVYERRGAASAPRASLVAALEREGQLRIGERTFRIQQGQLSAARGEVWRLSSPSLDSWLETVRANTWKRLGDIGKIHVGVKTTADKVFIRNDWSTLGANVPELLRPVITHHVARRYRARPSVRHILYPHTEARGGRRVADLKEHPRTSAYLEGHRATLEARRYLIDAGRKWFELWVPQEPSAWSRIKLVFRDIAEKPTFWVDRSGSVVNGDCYWMVTEEREDMLWLALAVANSTFIEAFYDGCFNNKLYAGRRRFMSQYVEQFPLPNPDTELAARLIALAKLRYDARDASRQLRLECEIDALVWTAFGVVEITR